ncbi:adenosylcobinamide-GDP ribazoletransferase [Octadecabacter sp. CECT 8868]|uniref:adenosylcobinamide-GDP ribazoletransferase n=1 Tax=Octadecabacter algicola TaxID=2909342 RepID=UPI001F429046|nr:adenosylcobinamide-GDP ribazoletransferase [Octadecabacter algicola]MCF2904408.1 adenosylcobinamide-GDP ribazoletransferase [Octadecabacter algicola]
MTPKDDTTPLFTVGDLSAALGLLSRLPVPVNTELATSRGGAAAWAYPIAGLAIGVIACFVGQVALWLGLPASLAAGLIVASFAITTGGMHEDGLADCADGFWGGWDKINRLKIMKDSHTGVYGVIALVLGLGLRWQAVALLLVTPFWPALICVAMLSRAAMVPMMAHLPHARTEGLSHSVGRPQPATAWSAMGIAGIAALILLQLAALWLLIATLMATLACAQIARAKVGGQTGDVLGATQQITEIAALLTLVAVLA